VINKTGSSDWARKLFVENAHLFFPILENMTNQAENEVEGIIKIFERHHIKPGARVLDLFCGIGRHSLWLAQKGYKVVGYDPSPFFLKKARNRALALTGKSASVRFCLGPPDIPSKVLLRNGEKSFNAILILFTSLGYVGTGEDIKILRDILNIADKNCILITETENRDWRIKNFEPFVEYKLKNLAIFERWKMNPETSVFEGDSDYYRVFDKGRRLQLALNLVVKMRLYSLHELINILKQSGWDFLQGYDGLVSSFPPTVESQNVVTVSTNNA
jgi:SAM-dependent methyltransferase